MPTMTYLQAISDGLRSEMRRDERVLVMGEDIGTFGGAFKVTDGFIYEFGSWRVMDTPLAESGIVGTAVGAAVVGLRPVCEMQFADFVSCGFDQLVNVAGKMYYRQGLPVNITVRLPERRRLLRRPVPLAEPRGVVHARARAEGRRAEHAGGRQGPAHRRDPRRRTRSCSSSTSTCTAACAARCPRGRSRRRSARASRARAPTSSSSPTARWSTRRWRRPRISRAPPIQVLDLRSLVPLDEDAILAAVRECSKVVVVDEANGTCAAGAQVAALIAEKGFEDLDGPVVRVATPDVPIPFSPPLEQAVLPSVDRVREACRELLAY